MSSKFRLRSRYEFGKLGIGEFKKIKLGTDPLEGKRALCAAYAFARRNGWTLSGFTKTGRTGNKTLEIHRVA